MTSKSVLSSPRFVKWFSEPAPSRTSPFSPETVRTSGSGCGTPEAKNEAPGIVRGLEQKTIEDLEEMHVDSVDQEDKPFSWKNPITGIHCNCVIITKLIY